MDNLINEYDSDSDDSDNIDFESISQNQVFKVELSSLKTQFLKGLKEYGLTYEDIIKSNYRYCGGSSGRHLNYFKLISPNEELPDLTDECVCGHHIKENCYITNGEEILILGNCCIKKFIHYKNRTCELCNNTHSNRKKNRCNNCRNKICDKCDAQHNNKNKLCNKCNNYKICKICNIKINSNLKGTDCRDCILKKCQQQREEKLENSKKECICCKIRFICNTKVIKCYECIKGFCKNCDKALTNSKYENCYKCNESLLIKCLDCDKKVIPKFKRCFECNNKYYNNYN